jgi:hypothetical protein
MFYREKESYSKVLGSRIWDPGVGARGFVISEIKLPPGAGAIITNYGSSSGSLLFYQKLEEIL